MKCPICKRGVEAGGKFAPFCGERCKLVDLGRWLEGKYQIPVVEEESGEDVGEMRGGEEERE